MCLCLISRSQHLSDSIYLAVSTEWRLMPFLSHLMQIPGLISSATNSLRVETEILEKKLQDAQIKLAEKDEDKEKEIQSLKRLISELEFQLTVEKNNNESFLDNMRKEIKHKSDELEKLTQERTQLIHSLSQVQEEVGARPRKCFAIFTEGHALAKII